MGLLTKFFGIEESPTGTPVNHGGPWERLATQHPHHGPRQDSHELSEINPEAEEPTDVDGVSIAFQYVDAAGEPTKRTLMCRRCWRANGVVYVSGRCLLRDHWRTFRVDRMSSVVNIRDKQPIPDPTAYFAKYAAAGSSGTLFKMSKMPTSEAFAGKLSASYGPGDRLADARRVCLDGVRVLAYVAILRNTQYTASDKAIEATYIAARLDDCGMGNDDALAAEVLKYALAIAVPTEAFNASLKILTADRRNFGMVSLQLAKITIPAGNDAQLAAINQVLDAAKERGWAAQLA
jgi:hypothetical protein